MEGTREGPVRISLCVLRLDNSLGHCWGRPEESSWAAAAGIGSNMVILLVLCRVILYRFVTPGVCGVVRLWYGVPMGKES